MTAVAKFGLFSLLSLAWMTFNVQAQASTTEPTMPPATYTCGSDNCVTVETVNIMANSKKGSKKYKSKKSKKSSMVEIVETTYCLDLTAPAGSACSVDGMTDTGATAMDCATQLLDGGCNAGNSGVHDASLKLKFCCLRSDGTCNSATTWEIGCGYTASWLWVDAIGIFVDFVPKNDDGTNDGVGSASYWFGGQCCPTDWAAGHLQVREYSVSPFGGTDCQSAGPFPYDNISWMHAIDVSSGSIRTASGMTEIRPNIIPEGATGFHRTNCNVMDELRTANVAIWAIDDGGEILQNVPSSWPSGQCNPDVQCTA